MFIDEPRQPKLSLATDITEKTLECYYDQIFILQVSGYMMAMTIRSGS